MDNKGKLLAIALIASLVANGYLGYTVYSLNGQLGNMEEMGTTQANELTALRAEMTSLRDKYNVLVSSYGALGLVDEDGNDIGHQQGVSDDSIFNGPSSGSGSSSSGSSEPFNPDKIPEIKFDGDEVTSSQPEVAVPKPPVSKPGKPSGGTGGNTNGGNTGGNGGNTGGTDSNGNPSKPAGWGDTLPDLGHGTGGLTDGTSIGDKDLSKEDTGSGGYQ